jgi:hypothetical protein
MTVLELIKAHDVHSIAKTDGGWRIVFALTGDINASVVMGDFAYSEPREDRNYLNDYISAEVMFITSFDHPYPSCFFEQYPELLNYFEDEKLAAYVEIHNLHAMFNILKGDFNP